MDDRSGQVIGVAVTFLLLSWITVSLRCYVRYSINDDLFELSSNDSPRTFMVKGFGLDDQLMVATLVVYTAYLVCQLGGAAHGTGQRRERLTDENAQTALRYWFFCEIFYTISTSLLKIAVGFFFLRITVSPFQVWTTRIIMAVSGVVGVGYTCLVLFQCKPISYWWDLNPNHTGVCLSADLVTNATYTVSALNSFADWTFGIIPIFIVKDLQMKKRVKVIVASVIALAAIGSTATIIRLPYTWTLKEYKGDFLYRTTDFAIWTTVEVGVGITAGCMATLKPLFKSTFSSLSGTRPSLNTPWSHSRKKSTNMFGHSLDEMKPAGRKTATTTTITGGKSASDSDEEIFLGSGTSYNHTGDMGINKSITTTVIEERSMSRAEGQHTSTGIPKRSWSLDGDSDSEKDRGKPVGVFERF